MQTNHNYTLEYKLFLMACIISMFVSLILTLIDFFVAKDYASSIVGVFSFFAFSFFYYQLKYKYRFEKIRTPFIVALIIIVNSVWFSGGGLNLTNAFVFFLILILIIIIAPTEIRALFVVIVFVNLVVFSALEFLYPTYSVQIVKDDRLLVIHTIVLFLVFSIVAYVMIFFKNQYDIERETVNKQNLKLDSSNTEIEAQNEELIQYQEEVMAQRDFIEEKNKKLEIQAIELEKANPNYKFIFRKNCWTSIMILIFWSIVVRMIFADR